MVKSFWIAKYAHFLEHSLQLRVVIVRALHLLDHQIHEYIMYLVAYLLVKPDQICSLAYQPYNMVAHPILPVLHNLSELLSNDSLDLSLEIVVVQFVSLQEFVDVGVEENGDDV